METAAIATVDQAAGRSATVDQAAGRSAAVDQAAGRSAAVDAQAFGELRARVGEFLVVGGATLLLYPVLWALRAAAGLDAAELAIGFLTFHAATLINDPHFAVTYLLFYRGARGHALGGGLPAALRARYLFAGLVAPATLVAWAGFGVTGGSAPALGWLVQLMFLLVRWHYVKQGFGVLMVLSARRGGRFSTTERAAVLGHCFAAGAYAWARSAGAAKEVEEKGVVYWTVATPPWLATATFAVFAASGLVMAAVLARKIAREGRMPSWAGLAGLLISVWAWTVWSSADPLMIYAIPALHSIQYLYFVWLVRRSEGRAAVQANEVGPSVATRVAVTAGGAVILGWLLLRGAPAFFDGARGWRAARAWPDLGPTPYFAAFFAVVNIHHYVMDNVIWRRDFPMARHLRR